MDKNLIEQLLNEDESATLDFKQEQYPFAKASDEQKSELLKDILALVNAWRRTDAYILIGVEEVKGGKSKVVGITHHLDEASLQQFVNSKTNQPVNFSYHALPYKGKQIGIIRIPPQERPFFLNKDYGKLSAKTVYIRRGSSTDRADPDEIARMGAATVALNQVPTIDLQFAEVESHTKMGRNITLQSEVLTLPSKSEIPEARGDYLTSIVNRPNPEYYRRFADYLLYTALLKPVGFTLRNTGTTVAHNTMVKIVQPRMKELLILDSSDYPSPPHYSVLSLDIPSGLRNILHNQNVTTITEIRDGWEISAKVGTIQPKVDAWSEGFYIGSIKPCSIDLEAHVFADNLPDSFKVPLALSITIKERAITVEELISIADEYH